MFKLGDKLPSMQTNGCLLSEPATFPEKLLMVKRLKLETEQRKRAIR